MNRKRNIWIG